MNQWYWQQQRDAPSLLMPYAFGHRSTVAQSFQWTAVGSFLKWARLCRRLPEIQILNYTLGVKEWLQFTKQQSIGCPIDPLLLLLHEWIINENCTCDLSCETQDAGIAQQVWMGQRKHAISRKRKGDCHGNLETKRGRKDWGPTKFGTKIWY